MAVCYKKMQLVISFFLPAVRSLWDFSAFYDYINVIKQAKKNQKEMGRSPLKMNYSVITFSFLNHFSTTMENFFVTF